MSRSKSTQMTQNEMNIILSTIETNLFSIRPIIDKDELKEEYPEYIIKLNRLLNETQQHIDRYKK